jgi:hypothetical protein
LRFFYAQKQAVTWNVRREKALAIQGFSDAKNGKGILQYQNRQKRLSNIPRKPRKEVIKNGSFPS